MAVNNRGTLVDLSTGYLPTGYTKPSITPMAEEYTRSATLTIAKTAVENASSITTIGNIVTNISAQITAIIGADYDDLALTIDVYTRIKAIKTNFNLDNVLYTNGVINYLVDVEYFIATT